MDKTKRSEAKAVTIYDIAREAGVSAATVSRVLTNNANVRPEKKQKILKLMKKYDFKPNALARGLSDTRSKVIGIIAADVRNPFYSEIFVSCELAAENYGYTVLLGNSLGDTEHEKIQLEKFQEQQVEAVIQFGGSVDDLYSKANYVEKVNLLTSRVPMVVTGKLDGTRCYQVRIDDTRSMDLIMEHLVGLGHRRIAVVGGRMDVLSTYEKFQRYRMLLDRYRIPFCPELVGEEGGYDSETGYTRMKAILEGGNIPTAVIAVNDFTAVGVMKSIQEAGYGIPDDISVISYDDTYIAELVTPALTSVSYDYRHFGKVLVETAIAAVEEREVPRSRLIEPKLVVRGSTGPARAAVEGELDREGGGKPKN